MAPREQLDVTKLSFLTYFSLRETCLLHKQSEPILQPTLRTPVRESLQLHYNAFEMR